MTSVKPFENEKDVNKVYLEFIYKSSIKKIFSSSKISLFTAKLELKVRKGKQSLLYMRGFDIVYQIHKKISIFIATFD